MSFYVNKSKCLSLEKLYRAPLGPQNRGGPLGIAISSTCVGYPTGHTQYTSDKMKAVDSVLFFIDLRNRFSSVCIIWHFLHLI